MQLPVQHRRVVARRGAYSRCCPDDQLCRRHGASRLRQRQYHGCERVWGGRVRVAAGEWDNVLRDEPSGARVARGDFRHDKVVDARSMARCQRDCSVQGEP